LLGALVVLYSVKLLLDHLPRLSRG